jgi:hypothetical protein
MPVSSVQPHKRRQSFSESNVAYEIRKLEVTRARVYVMEKIGRLIEVGLEFGTRSLAMRVLYSVIRDISFALRDY